MSLNAAVAAFLSGLDGISPIKRRTKNGAEGFSWSKRRSCSTPDWLSKILVKHGCALLLVRGRRPAMSITPQAAASWLRWLWKTVTGPLWIRKTERFVQSYFFLIFAFTMGHFPWWIHGASSTNLGNIASGTSDEGSSCSLDHQDTWLIAALWGGLQKDEGSLKINRGGKLHAYHGARFSVDAALASWVDWKIRWFYYHCAQKRWLCNYVLVLESIPDHIKYCDIIYMWVIKHNCFIPPLNRLFS